MQCPVTKSLSSATLAGARLCCPPTDKSRVRGWVGKKNGIESHIWPWRTAWGGGDENCRLRDCLNPIFWV